MNTLKHWAIFALSLIITLPIMAQQTEQITVPLSSPGKPYKLNIHFVSGSISVEGYDGKEILITAKTSAPRKTNATVNGMRRLNSNDNMDVTATEKDNLVSVTSGMPMKAVNVTVKIPKGATSIKLTTVNDGDITASNISGDIEVINVNGHIKLTDVAGAVVANTVNGHVIVVFRSIDPNAAMAFSTLNGNADVTFPASFKANVKLRSERGDVFSDFDVTPDKRTQTTTSTAKDGMYRIKIEDWVYGKINGGGPELLMKTMNGNVYVRKGK